MLCDNIGMTNKNIKFVCQNCGAEFSRWEGRCKSCGEWNTIIETIIDNKKFSKNRISYDIENLSSLVTTDLKRLKSGLLEFDRTIGGGYISGQVLLISGNPGVGKSTLLLQLSALFKKKVLYISGEESVNQIAGRAKRLGLDISNVYVTSADSIDGLFEVEGYDLVVFDSIQTLRTDDIHSTIGSSSQIREVANKIISFCKRNNIVGIIVAHITKSGEIAGPKLLEHLVDTVLYLEGDKNNIFRLLKVHKNRYGDSSEVGIFEMKETGLSEISSNSGFLLSDLYTLENRVGSALGMSIEGTRVLALEIQALVGKTSFGYPKRTVNGYSLTRLSILIMVMQKALSLKLDENDVYLNIPSGLIFKDPGLDLAVCASIYSSFKNRPIKDSFVFFGEVGLSGEIRKVAYEEKRTKESRSMGFKHICSSQVNRNINSLSDILV